MSRQGLLRPVERPLKGKIPLYKTEEEREGLRQASRFNAQLMDFLRPHVKEGVTTDEIDRLAYQYTVDHGHTPACLNYCGYPKTVCTSVNEIVCHGIPNNRRLKAGDIVNVDLTTKVENWFGDQSETFLIEPVSVEARELVQATFDALWIGINAIRPNGRVNDIGRAIARHAKKHGLSVVQEYQGHGIGRAFHQEPGVPHYPCAAGRVHIKSGTCFTIEPMLNQGTWRTKIDQADGWTVRTADGKLSAQFEHTVLMTDDRLEVLTITDDGPQQGHQF
ncbi:MAG: type I methionyl aminopeptidase [Planctomycetaceae bacterium]|nr:type I methionyl aminopeptidase [Planctomycetaceae bacterium]